MVHLQHRRVPMEVGLNRFVWDTRHADAVRFPGMILWAGETRGPKMAPGTYQVKLTVDGKALTQNFEIKADPRLSTTPADYAKQLELGLKIRDKLSETHNAILQIRDVRRQVEDLLKRVAGQPNFKAVNDAGTALNKNLTAIEETLYQTKNQSNQDPLNYPIRLNNKLAALGGVVGSAEAAPTAQSYAVYDEVVTQIDAQLQKLAQIMRTDVPGVQSTRARSKYSCGGGKTCGRKSVDVCRGGSPWPPVCCKPHLTRGRAATEGRPYNQFHVQSSGMTEPVTVKQLAANNERQAHAAMRRLSSQT